jgi:hypothetical protein
LLLLPLYEKSDDKDDNENRQKFLSFLTTLLSKSVIRLFGHYLSENGDESDESGWAKRSQKSSYSSKANGR